MKRFLGFSAAILSASLLATSSASAISSATAVNVFARMAVAPELRNPSVSLIDLSTGKVVFESNGDSQRKPASLMKLLSAAATVKYLDPKKVFATSVALGTEPDSLVIDGELDPWMSTNSVVAEKMHRTSLYGIAAKGLRAAKKKSDGSLKKLQVYYNEIYSGEVAAIKAYYKKLGVTATFVKVSDTTAKSIASDQIVYSTSPTVKEIMIWFLLWSDNVVSERMARIAAKASGNESNEQGVAKMFNVVLTDMGIDPTKIIVKDASGLSRKNKVTANILGQLLYKVHSDPAFAKIIEGLPVGGKTGTMRNRFVKTAPKAIGLVKAKTGTLTGTVSLAGFAQSGDREYAFVIIADQLKGTRAASAVARNSLDRYLAKISAPLLVPVIETATTSTN